MRMKRKGVYVFLIMSVLLLICCCADRDAEPPLPANEAEDAVIMEALFNKEDGNRLYGSTILLTFGENSLEHSLAEDGTLKISGLPRAGEWMLTVLDQQEHVQGAMTLSLTEGAVVDATTDDSGIGHITLRRDAEEVSLFFTLKDDGGLLCALWLSQPSSPGSNSLQNGRNTMRLH